MSHAKRAFRPSTSWSEVTPPRLLTAEERGAPFVPWGLGNDEPPLEPGLDPKEVYLCVLCWEWHTGAACGAPGHRRSR